VLEAVGVAVCALAALAIVTTNIIPSAVARAVRIRLRITCSLR
jgi:hypothetical protein